jgi:hypothetical protein
MLSPKGETVVEDACEAVLDIFENLKTRGYPVTVAPSFPKESGVQTHGPCIVSLMFKMAGEYMNLRIRVWGSVLTILDLTTPT